MEKDIYKRKSKGNNMIIRFCFVTIVFVVFSAGIVQAKSNEDSYNKVFCASIGGKTETRHSYKYPGGKGYIRVDCETTDTVYEGGVDNKRSSLDSVQQSLFASSLTGKSPAVVIYDTDGKMGRFEYRIKTACEIAKVKFIHYR